MKKILLPLLSALLSSGAVHASQSRPNLIVLLTDDQTIGAVGCYGNKEILTPNIDQLASKGVRFLNHYNTTSICMASRASILTGLYEYRHGCNFTHGDLERSRFDQSYPAVLRQAGYFTGFAGKIGFEIQKEPFDAFEREFDVWAGGPGQTDYDTAKNKGIAKYAAQYPHCSRAYGAWGQDFIKTAKQTGKPFCMSISFKAPHLPQIPDPADLKLYSAIQSFSRPLNYGVEKATHLSPQVQTSRAATAYREWVKDYDSTVRHYYALITGVDAAIGMIREELERQGLADNTVILFTSDNGYNAGSHGFGDKVVPYEEGSKAPLILLDPRLPKETAGKTCAAITANVDAAATLFALAHVQPPQTLDGHNLEPLLRNPGSKVRDWLPLFNFWGVPSAQSMAVVSEDWKYIHWFYGAQEMTPTEELFHLSHDRLEMSNVAHEPRFERELAAARKAYDAELSLIQPRLASGHGYEPYPVLFDRVTPWDRKDPSLREIERSQSQSEGNKPSARPNKKTPPREAKAP
jgi:arylsulfatase A-like enzyme